MKVVVVGSSDSVLAKNLGKKIDACDIVMRTNNSKFKGFQKYVGSRTDYLFVRTTGARNLTVESKETKIIVVGGITKALIKARRIRNKILFWKNAHDIMKRTYEIDFSVSSGVMAICYWLCQKIRPVYVVGVEGFVSAGRYEGRKHRTDHDSVEEKQWLDFAVEKGWVEYL